MGRRLSAPGPLVILIFLWILDNFTLRLDLIGDASGLAPAHVAVERGSSKMLAILLKERDNWDVNIR